MFNALRDLLGRAGQTVHSAENSIFQSPVAKAIESQIPFIPQTAIAPESLRPGTQGADEFSPYAINGKPAPAPAWSVLPGISARMHPTAPMPQALGLPDYTAHSRFDYSHPSVPVDSPNPVLGAWQPKAQLIQPALPITPNDPYGDKYPRFQS